MASAAKRASTKWGIPILKPPREERENPYRQIGQKIIELDIGMIKTGYPKRQLIE